MNLSEFLTKQASEIRNSAPEVVAMGYLVQTGMSEQDARITVAQHLMEKAATEALTQKGIDYDVAIELVKVAGIDLKKTADFKPTLSQEEILADTLEKAASQALGLEGQLQEALQKIASLEALVEDLQSEVSEEAIPEPIMKLAQSGDFTNEDLAALMSLPQDTLTKVATKQEAPWKMGKSASTNGGSSDPLLDFIMS